MHGGHTASEQPGPCSDTAAGVDSTWTAAYAETAVGHIGSDADHAAMERRLKRESWTGVCGMTSEDREVGACALRPSCRKCL